MIGRHRHGLASWDVRAITETKPAKTTVAATRDSKQIPVHAPLYHTNEAR